MKFNMKKYFPVTALGLSLLLSGCADSFLEKSPSDYITSRRFAGSGKMELQHLNGTSLRYIFHHLCYEFRRDGEVMMTSDRKPLTLLRT